MQWIEKCLLSIRQSQEPVEVIVIDNCSADNTVTFIRESFPFVTLVETGRNLGFGQGNNLGINLALQRGADGLLLLNQDAWIEPDTVMKLKLAAEQHPEYGILSPLHLDGSGNHFDDHFSTYLQTTYLDKILFDAFVSKNLPETIIPISFVNAAAWFVTVKCIRLTGGFDPIFFHYGEDDNFGQRVRFKGFKIGVVHNAIIYHDKERVSPMAQIPLLKKINAEWTQFLVYACDPFRKNPVRFIRRRMLGHLVRGAVAMAGVKKEEGLFHLTLAKRMRKTEKDIIESRRRALTSGPYLKLSSDDKAHLQAEL